ncbi:MAG: hypothetical protein ACPGOV_02140 [Magnetovibrionaceae bacterium]
MDIGQGVFDFSWPVCRDGYTIIDCAPDGQRPMVAVKALSPEPGDYEWKSSDQLLGVHRALMEMKPTEAGALEFVTRFGVLHVQNSLINWDELTSYDICFVEDLLKLQRQIRPFIQAVAEADEDITHRFNEAFKSPLFGVQYTDLSSGLFRLVPADLKAFIVLMVANELSGDIEWRRCANPNCEETFAVQTKPRRYRARGVGTMRKITCGAARCQQALSRLKRAGSKSETD